MLIDLLITKVTDRRKGQIMVWSGVQVTRCGMKCSREKLGLWAPAESQLDPVPPVT